MSDRAITAALTVACAAMGIALVAKMAGVW